MAGVHYVLHHPLLGAGPGQFRVAMDSTATLSFFQNVLAGRILTDGHDIFVEVAVTTGLLGLICFLVWLLGTARMAPRSNFLGFAAAMMAVELVEPINVAILPLTFLGLGATAAARLERGETADPTVHEPVSEQPIDGVVKYKPVTVVHSRVVTFVAIAMGLFLGATMVIGDAYMWSGTNHSLGQPFNLAAAKDTNRLLPYWPDSALEVAQVEAFDSLGGRPGDAAFLAESRHWTAVAVGRDLTDPDLWTLLARADTQLKAYGRARSEYYRALACDRWYTQAFEGLGELAGIERNWTEAVHWYRLAAVTDVKVPLDSAQLRGLLEEAERHAGLAHG